MKYLGGFNLFVSHFIIGTKEVDIQHTKTKTFEIEALHHWLKFKDNDWGMKRYRTNRTQYIDFLHIIELELLKKIVEALHFSYSKDLPYSNNNDFINDVFGYSTFCMEKFLKMNLVWLGEPTKDCRYTFFTCYSREDLEFIDFAIEKGLSIDYYKQYYRAVLSYFGNFKEETEQEKIILDQKKIERLADLINHERSVEIIDKVKSKYQHIKGKRLKLLLLAFQKLELIPSERIASEFYRCCKKEFNWDIASYNAMNGYQFSVHSDKDELERMIQYLESLINTK